MSVHVMSWVLRHSEATLANRLVLLVLADHADGDGRNAYPSVPTIAHEARISERQAYTSLRALKTAGSIAPAGRGPYGTTNYTVVMGTPADSASPHPADSAGREISTPPLQNLHSDPADPAGKPSKNRPEPSDALPALVNYG